jgi:hypothetical protein
MLCLMGDMLKLICWVVTGLFRSRAKRVAFNNFDRFVFGSLYRIAPGVLKALVIVKPETVIGWHRAGIRLYWR